MGIVELHRIASSSNEDADHHDVSHVLAGLLEAALLAQEEWKLCQQLAGPRGRSRKEKRWNEEQDDRARLLEKSIRSLQQKQARAAQQLQEALRGDEGRPALEHNKYNSNPQSGPEEEGDHDLSSPKEKTEASLLITSLLLPMSWELATDPTGRFVCEKLLEFGGPEARRRFLGSEGLRDRIAELAMHPQGCHVLQVAFQVLGKRSGSMTEEDTDVQHTLVEQLNGHVPACVESPNGNHVIQETS